MHRCRKHTNKKKEGEKRLVPTEKNDLPFFQRHFSRVTKTPVVVRRCVARGACCKEMIEALMDAPSAGPLNTDAANAIVQHVWLAFRPFVFIDLGCVFVSVLVLCLATVKNRAGGTVPFQVCLPSGSHCWSVWGQSVLGFAQSHHVVLLSILVGKSILEEVAESGRLRPSGAAS